MAGYGTALVGRERHLRELGMLVDGVAEGRGNALLLSGEAGAGKTALAEAAAGLARDAALTVAWATCWASAAAPLATWLDLRAQVNPELGVALTAGPAEEVDPELARAARVRSLVTELRAATAGRPTLFVIDDVQWCDQLSLHAIHGLMGWSKTSPLGIVVTCRDDAPSTTERLSDLSQAARHLVVPPLSDGELIELAVGLTGRPPSTASLRTLAERSGGNALYARELLTTGEETAMTRAVAPLVGSRAVEMFGKRLAVLPPDCAHLLETASVIGRRFRLDVLAEAVGLELGRVLPMLDEAQRARLIRQAGIGSCEFVHPLIAEACYSNAEFARRVRLHRDVAEALERLRDRGLTLPSAELAHHYAHAAAGGTSEKAVEYSERAGREGMDQLAYEDAARDFARALDALALCPENPPRLADLLLQLADAHAACGDLPAARAAYEEVAQLARHHGWPDRLARAALGVGSGPGGFEVPPFDRFQIMLLEEATPLASGVLRSQVLSRLSVALSLDADGERRAALSREAIALARDAGDASAVGYALASWCDVMAGPAHVEARREAADEVLECAAKAGDSRLELLGRRLRVVALLEDGSIDAVDDEIGEFARTADRLGQVVYSWYVPLWRSMRAAMEGRLEANRRLLDDAERLGRLAHSENATILIASHIAMLGCELHDPEQPARYFAELAEQWPDYELMTRPAVAYATATAGKLEQATTLLACVELHDYTEESLGSEWLPSLVMLAHTTALTRTGELAQPLYESLLPFRARHAVDGIGGFFMGSVERPLGMLAALLGDRARATEHIGAALSRHRAMRAQLLVAGTLRDGAAALGDDVMASAGRNVLAALGIAPTLDVRTAGPVSATTNVFRREGDGWLVGIDGATVRVGHTKGMGDLAQLLGQPGTELHALDLVATGPTVATPSTGDAIDDTARRQYRKRVLDLEADLSEADRHGDVARSEKLHAERDALIAELSSAYGIGGRARRRGDSAERARSAVTQRIRDAIARIESAEPGLGRHLRQSIRTGTFCAYRPDEPRAWDL